MYVVLHWAIMALTCAEAGVWFGFLLFLQPKHCKASAPSTRPSWSRQKQQRRSRRRCVSRTPARSSWRAFIRPVSLYFIRVCRSLCSGSREDHLEYRRVWSREAETRWHRRESVATRSHVWERNLCLLVFLPEWLYCFAKSSTVYYHIQYSLL